MGFLPGKFSFSAGFALSIWKQVYCLLSMKPSLILLALLLLFHPFWSIGQQGHDHRHSPALSSFLIGRDSGITLDALVSVKNLSLLKEKKYITILSEYTPAQVALIRTTIKELQQLTRDSLLLFADLRRQPKEEL